MKRNHRRIVRSTIAVFLAIAALLVMRSFFSKRPATLGVQNRQLHDCPSSPNCVCTQATDAAHQMEPIPFFATGAEALTAAKAALGKLPRSEVITEEPGYLHAEVTSLIFRFIDDVEIFVDESAKLIHFRSASRVGHSDLGVNRARMEQVRNLIESELSAVSSDE